MSYETIRELATVKETAEIRKMQLSHWCRRFFDGEEYYKFWELLIKQIGSNSRSNETDPDLANLVNFLSEIEHAKRKTHELIPAAKERDASYFPSWITTKERISIIKEMMKNEEFINAPQKSLNRKEEAALDNPELQELERNPQWSDINDLITELAEETKKHLFGTSDYKLHDVVGEVLSRLIYTPHAQALSQTNTKLSGIIQKTNSTPGGGIGYNAELLTNKGYIRITELYRNQDAEVEIACYCPETKETLYYPQSEVIIKKSSGDTDASVNGIKVNSKQRIHTKTKKWKRDVSIEHAKKLNVSEDTKTSTSPYWGERDIPQPNRVLHRKESFTRRRGIRHPVLQTRGGGNRRITTKRLQVQQRTRKDGRHCPTTSTSARRCPAVHLRRPSHHQGSGAKHQRATKLHQYMLGSASPQTQTTQKTHHLHQNPKERKEKRNGFLKSNP